MALTIYNLLDRRGYIWTGEEWQSRLAARYTARLHEAGLMRAEVIVELDGMVIFQMPGKPGDVPALTARLDSLGFAVAGMATEYHKWAGDFLTFGLRDKERLQHGNAI